MSDDQELLPSLLGELMHSTVQSRRNSRASEFQHHIWRIQVVPSIGMQGHLVVYLDKYQVLIDVHPFYQGCCHELSG